MRRCYKHNTPDGVQVLVAVAGYKMSLLRSEEQEETIRFHLRHGSALRDFLMESFDRFRLPGLTLIWLKTETKADVERDLRDLISAAGSDAAENAARIRLTQTRDELLPELEDLDMLVRRGLLTFHPHDPDDPDEKPNPWHDRWAPKQELVNRMLRIRRKQEEERKAKMGEPPTHERSTTRMFWRLPLRRCYCTGEPVSLSNRRPEIVYGQPVVGLRRNRLDYTAN